MTRIWPSTRTARGGLALISLAAVIRIALWLQNRSLWIDEARLSLNVATRPYLRLLPPLDYDQSAPLFFLWLQRSAVLLFGLSDRSLRLAALVAGIGIVPLVYLIAKRLLGSRVALLATGMVALSPSLIYFANEAKQYGVEAFVSCCILYATLRWLDDPSSAVWRAALVLLGMIAVWLASAAPFVLAGAGLSVLLTRRVEPRARIRWAALLGVCWGASLALAYTLVYRFAVGDPYLRRYWSGAFLTPGRPGVVGDTGVALRAVLWGPMFRDSFGGSTNLEALAVVFAISVVLALILVVGLRRIGRTAGANGLALLASPLALAFVASAMGAYPVSARSTVFFLPALMIGAAAGVDELAGRLRWRALRWTLLTLSWLPLALVTWADLTDRDPRENLRPLIAALEQHRRPGEPVYVLAGTIPAWAMYTTDWHSPDGARLGYLARIARADGPAFENAPSRGRPVQREGTGLVYSTPAGVEVYGVPEGIEAHIFALNKREPDQGWTENEATRIRDVANPGVWLVLSHVWGSETELLQLLEAWGARATYRDFRRGAGLVRYEFPARRADASPASGASR